MATHQLEILAQRLAGLLGMDDGAEDLLDHLLSIDSMSDIKEYLSQLLGSINDDGAKFLDEIERFRRGELLQPIAQGADTPTTETTTTQISTPLPTKTKTESGVARQRREQTISGKPEYRKPLAHPVAPRTIPAPNKKDPPPKKNLAKTKPAKQAPVKHAPKASKPSAPVVQANGEAKTCCGCFGTQHKPLTNCLRCGRISCEREGYDFCNSCGYLIQSPSPPEPGDLSYNAWLLKNKVLSYQEEKAARTEVFDDQADHIGVERSQWLTKNEQKDMEEKQQEKMEALHMRRKVQLTLG